MNKKVWVGIDPGKDGAVAYITENGDKKAIKTPKIGKEYDLQAMSRIIDGFREHDVTVVLENISSHPAKGRQSAFVMGKGVAYWEAFLVAHKVKYVLVTPGEWQKETWKGIKEQRKAPTGTRKKGAMDTKKMSLLAAQRLFPDFDFRASERSSNPHDGIVDAMLIAEFCKRRF